MKRLAALAALAALVVLAAGCHFPQGWHWPRLAANGSSTTQTLVCFQNDLVNYQGPLLQSVADQLNAHPEIVIHMRGTCESGRNRVIFRTADINGGLTGLGISSGVHIGGVTVTIDDDYGRTADGRNVFWHETCHAFGGGWSDNDDIHRLCNLEHKQHHMAELSRVYHNDPG